MSQWWHSVIMHPPWPETIIMIAHRVYTLLQGSVKYPHLATGLCPSAALMTALLLFTSLHDTVDYARWFSVCLCGGTFRTFRTFRPSYSRFLFLTTDCHSVLICLLHVIYRSALDSLTLWSRLTVLHVTLSIQPELQDWVRRRCPSFDFSYILL
jgi:hypothetical protein